ncbi:hypothetical protein [Streptomyces galilaeus]|uniref:hypothetical protein n=1 Tax=Streptomyces galilaeus TaxID=33899 RepID=UPI00123CA2C2|nr:hypothetical protein [Streptomyces galilaeus]
MRITPAENEYFREGEQAGSDTYSGQPRRRIGKPCAHPEQRNADTSTCGYVYDVAAVLQPFSRGGDLTFSYLSLGASLTLPLGLLSLDPLHR